MADRIGTDDCDVANVYLPNPQVDNLIIHLPLGLISKVKKIDRQERNRTDISNGFDVICKDIRDLRFQQKREQHAKVKVVDKLQQLVLPLMNQMVSYCMFSHHSFLTLLTFLSHHPSLLPSTHCAPHSSPPFYPIFFLFHPLLSTPCYSSYPTPSYITAHITIHSPYLPTSSENNTKAT